jgi:outer membrane protein
MRTFVYAATAAVAFSLASATSAHAQAKIAFINSQSLLQVAPGRQEAEAQFQQQVDLVRAQEKAMQDSLQAMIADYQKVEATLSPADKQARENTIRGKQQSFQQRQQTLEQSAQSKQQELIQPIIDKVQRVLQDVRVEDGYTAILDIAPNSGGSVVAYDKNLDITDRVAAKVRALPVANGTSPSTTTPAKSNLSPSPSGVTRPKTPN